MTRRERDIKDRFWLKLRRFAVTKSLAEKLNERSELKDQEKEFCCYIQSKVLRETRDDSNQFANIGAKYWDDKCGGNYRRWVDLLMSWDELDVNEKYRKGTPAEKGFTMSYRVPPKALASGVMKIDFKRKATAIQDQTALNEADDIIRYVHQCCSRLTVPRSLVEIADPVRNSASHEFSRRVFWGDFNIRYGDNGRRLFHSIIEMPRDARSNLVFKGETGPSLFEYDIKSCHPVLLLPLFRDPSEWAKFATVLDHDIYSTIRTVMGVPEDRDSIKVQFMVCINSTDRYVIARRGTVYRFFAEYFPNFTRDVLDVRSDLAEYLQQQEPQIMVQELGRFCMERNLFWIPCHDGWLGIEEGEEAILKKVGMAFFQATGYTVRVTRTGLGIRNPVLIEGEISSYVPIEPTFTPSDYRKSAQDWFASLPKHPEPDAELQKTRLVARKNRKDGFRDHQRRDSEAKQLREELRPLWNRIMNRGDQKAA